MSPLRWLLVACIVAASSSARAEPTRAPIVVLESAVGPRPVDDDAMRDFRAELEAAGFAASPDAVLAIIGNRAPVPGVLDRGKGPGELTTAELIAPVDIGYQAWTQADFETAKGVLVRAVTRLRRNPALLVTDTSNLAAIYRAQLGLALSLAKLGDAAESEAIMMELIRMFPTQPISREEYGPEAWSLYRTVVQRANALGRGRLAVDAGNDLALIFVDGQLRGTGKVQLSDLIPGLHRVFIQRIGGIGRQYAIDVAAKRDAKLAVDWAVDSAVWATRAWVGLQFETEAQRASQERAIASKLCARWSGTGIIVAGMRTLRGQRAIAGTLYDESGDVVRSASVTLDDDRAQKLRSLAQFLADGRARDDRLVGAVGVETAAEPRDAQRAPPRWLIGSLVAGGMLATTAGAVLPAARDTHDARRIGVDMSIIGGAMLGTGTYVWCRRSTDLSRTSAALLGAGIGALAASIATYLVDEDPGPAGRPVIVDTALYSATAGIAGTALVGAALLVWSRESSTTPRRHARALTAAGKPRPSITPRIAVHPRGVTVGWQF